MYSESDLTAFFVFTFFRFRYQIILKFLHFADNSTYDAEDPDCDRLFKVRPIIDHFNETSQELYSATKRVSVDEQLLLHKGNLHFKQYIPNKRTRFGIKFFSLCDETGYVYKTEVYVGKNSFDEDEGNKDLGKTGQVVMRLMDPLLDMGHYNWYTSFALFKELKARKTLACGTVKWTTKVAFHFIEEALFNAHILYNMSLPPPMTYTNFKLAYVEAMLSPLPDPETYTQRYASHHYPETVPIIDPKKPSRMK